MSSSSGLSRTRSLRNPAAGSSGISQKDAAPARKETGIASPSRIPMKPLTRSATTSGTTSSTASSRTRAPNSTTSRPVSGVFSSKASSRLTDNAAPPPPSTATTRPLGRAPSTRQARPSTTSVASTSTSTTSDRPKSSGGPPSTTSSRERPTGHSRAKSTVTSLTAATTLRPLSQTSSGSASATPTTATFSKPQTRSQTQARTLPHSRTQSQFQPTTQRQQSQQQQPQPQQPPAAATSRPAFNTNQQHYSPAKSLAPKPLTSTYLAPPSPSKLPSNVALSAETSRLQTELLQLSLLHRDAAAVDAAWHESARRKLGAQFARLADGDRELARTEREGVEARSIGALVRWGEQGDDDDGRGGNSNNNNNNNNNGKKGKRGLEEKVQILDEVLNGVWALGAPGGRYQRVVRGFEAWAEQMGAIVTAQRRGDVDALVRGDGVLFLGGLDRGWKRECAGLVRKLDGWRAALGELGDVVVDDDDDDDNNNGDGEQQHQQQQQRSGLSRALDGCRSLVHDMLAELDVMEQIERDAASAEDGWIERMNEEVPGDGDGGGDTPRGDVPLWKLVV